MLKNPCACVQMLKNSNACMHAGRMQPLIPSASHSISLCQLSTVVAPGGNPQHPPSMPPGNHNHADPPLLTSTRGRSAVSLLYDEGSPRSPNVQPPRTLKKT